MSEREYTLYDFGFPAMKIKVKNPKDCIFCDHCDVFWDYTNGPYMLICGKQCPEVDCAETPEEHTCELFTENEMKGE